MANTPDKPNAGTLWTAEQHAAFNQWMSESSQTVSELVAGSWEGEVRMGAERDFRPETGPSPVQGSGRRDVKPFQGHETVV